MRPTWHAQEVESGHSDPAHADLVAGVLSRMVLAANPREETPMVDRACVCDRSPCFDLQCGKRLEFNFGAAVACSMTVALLPWWQDAESACSDLQQDALHSSGIAWWLVAGVTGPCRGSGVGECAGTRGDPAGAWVQLL